MFEKLFRTNVLKLIANILHNDTITFDYDFLHQKLVPLMQRLDDSSDQMRILSAQVTIDIINNALNKNSALRDSFAIWSAKNRPTIFNCTAVTLSMRSVLYSSIWTIITTNSPSTCAVPLTFSSSSMPIG